jgi:hypothetical protein
MTSAQKLKTNCANAQASTGPKTVRGKIRAAQNARRHGLSLSVISDLVISEQVESLAREIAGAGTDNEAYQLARRIAEAQVDLIRIRQARHNLLTRNISDPDNRKGEVLSYNAKLAKKIGRHIGMSTPIPQELRSLFRSVPQGRDKVMAIHLDLTKQLTLMDRYERRALSRRKFAIRAFDLARQQALKPEVTRG